MRALDQLSALSLAVLSKIQRLSPLPLDLNLHFLSYVVHIEHLHLPVKARSPLRLILREHLSDAGELLLCGDHGLALGLLTN